MVFGIQIPIKNIPFSQLAAGDLSKSLATVDDYFRHMITLISQKQVCFSELSYQNTKDLLGKLNIKLNASVLPRSPSLWEAKPSVRSIFGFDQFLKFCLIWLVFCIALTKVFPADQCFYLNLPLQFPCRGFFRRFL